MYALTADKRRSSMKAVASSVRPVLGVLAVKRGKKMSAENYKTIKPFIQEHFEQLEALRNEGYTWSKIAKKVIAETNIRSKDLTRTLQRTFYKIQIERE